MNLHSDENNALHRPANILLSAKNIPVLVDFGFAEMYDLKTTKAFHSNLSYGTPEVSIFEFFILCADSPS